MLPSVLSGVLSVQVDNEHFRFQNVISRIPQCQCLTKEAGYSVIRLRHSTCTNFVKFMSRRVLQLSIRWTIGQHHEVNQSILDV